ncbi:MAG TPA: M28 family peptidase [Pyrinomonadaceae bacterium]|nr:M28 family peptidase [Pyrinomonadaceae bacterium]
MESNNVKSIVSRLVCLALCFVLPADARPASSPSPLMQDAQRQATLLPDATMAALASELSGETAKRNLESISRQHRMRGSRGFRASAEHIASELRAYGLSDVKIEQFAADGKIFYGTQRSRPPWNAEFAELWEMREGVRGAWEKHARLASWDAMPITLAQDSESGEAEADLVDVGAGTAETDYANKEVRGRLVLASQQPSAVARLAVERHGAAGIISYAQNQRTAWYGEDENLIRWGHLDTFAARPTFAFMVSLKQARSLQSRLARGERVRLRASVRAGKQRGSYDVLTATIPGSDAALRDEEIAFSCHLDHPRPGANDNASGSVAILEVARTLSKLVREGRIPAPRRTIRFIWPPEIEGTLALLNARPEIARRTKAVIHMDMVGGGPATKAVFHVTRGPASLPSFVNDVAEHFGEYANDQSSRFAAGESFTHSLHSPEGGREPLQAEFADFSMGSDHQVYTDSSFAIPAIYLNDWPDRYIHTNFDTPANVDPTKLKRAAFIGAASGYFLANVRAEDAPSVWRVMRSRGLVRLSTTLARRDALADEEAAALTRFHVRHERALFDSMGRFFQIGDALRAEASAFLDGEERLFHLTRPVRGVRDAGADGQLVFRRNPDLKGTMSAFGYDYFTDHYGAEREAAVRLLRFEGLRGSGGEYAYEVLNLADGRRDAREIRDTVSAVYGPVPLELVVEYLRALETIGVVKRVR